jgi:hypothetical protein
MRDILKLAVVFFGILLGVMLLGALLSSCGRDNVDSEPDTAEESEEVLPTSQPAQNPLTVRGTASIDMSNESIRNGFFEAVMFEGKPDGDPKSATPIASVSEEGINHMKQLPTQFDFRMTIPNAVPGNTYFVYGAVYSTPEKLTVLVEGKCQNTTEVQYCSVVGEGNMVNYWMDLDSPEVN